MNIKGLQTRLGVTADGDMGRGTFAALFRKFGAGPIRAAELALSANTHFPKYGIMENELRLAHFMAQLIHESGGFKYMEEIASGSAYEGRADLGNVVDGDGRRFKGRGPIQLTGRANYRKFGRSIGIDLENHPEIAAIPSIGLHTALEYWDDRKLNAYADRDDVLGITKRINGGTNGLDDRKKHLAVMKAFLA
jgi:putative chitinase